MAFKTGDAIGDAIDRLTTQAGAILIGGIALFGIIRTAAGQDVVRGVIERILHELETADWREDLGPNQTDAVETVEAELEALIAELPLALGLDPAIATVLWLIAYVLGLAVLVVAIDTFAHERDTLSGLETERVGWKVLNLFFGTIVFAILVFIGLLLLVVPGLLLIIFLLFFPVAIVVNDESFFAAFSSSIGVARGNVLGTIAIILVTIVVSIAITVGSSVLDDALPPVPGAIVGEVLAAIALAFTFALIARAYMAATTDEPVDEDSSEESQPEEPAPAEEDWAPDGPA